MSEDYKPQTETASQAITQRQKDLVRIAKAQTSRYATLKISMTAGRTSPGGPDIISMMKIASRQVTVQQAKKEYTRVSAEFSKEYTDTHVKTVENILTRQGIDIGPNGLDHHSEIGSAYAQKSATEYLKSRGILSYSSRTPASDRVMQHFESIRADSMEIKKHVLAFDEKPFLDSLSVRERNAVQTVISRINPRTCKEKTLLYYNLAKRTIELDNNISPLENVEKIPNSTEYWSERKKITESFRSNKTQGKITYSRGGIDIHDALSRLSPLQYYQLRNSDFVKPNILYIDHHGNEITREKIASLSFRHSQALDEETIRQVNNLFSHFRPTSEDADPLATFLSKKGTINGKLLTAEDKEILQYLRAVTVKSNVTTRYNHSQKFLKEAWLSLSLRHTGEIGHILQRYRYLKFQTEMAYKALRVTITLAHTGANRIMKTTKYRNIAKNTGAFAVNHSDTARAIRDGVKNTKGYKRLKTPTPISETKTATRQYINDMMEDWTGKKLKKRERKDYKKQVRAEKKGTKKALRQEQLKNFVTNTPIVSSVYTTVSKLHETLIATPLEFGKTALTSLGSTIVSAFASVGPALIVMTLILALLLSLCTLLGAGAKSLIPDFLLTPQGTSADAKRQIKDLYESVVQNEEDLIEEYTDDASDNLDDDIAELTVQYFVMDKKGDKNGKTKWKAATKCNNAMQIISMGYTVYEDRLNESGYLQDSDYDLFELYCKVLAKESIVKGKISTSQRNGQKVAILPIYVYAFRLDMDISDTMKTTTIFSLDNENRGYENFLANEQEQKKYQKIGGFWNKEHISTAMLRCSVDWKTLYGIDVNTFNFDDAESTYHNANTNRETNKIINSAHTMNTVKNAIHLEKIDSVRGDYDYKISKTKKYDDTYANRIMYTLVKNAIDRNGTTIYQQGPTLSRHPAKNDKTDCSGFVSWVYAKLQDELHLSEEDCMNKQMYTFVSSMGFNGSGQLVGRKTTEYYKSIVNIKNKDDKLQPGDILVRGITSDYGDASSKGKISNHAAIFMGYTKSGYKYIDCTSHGDGGGDIRLTTRTTNPISGNGKGHQSTGDWGGAIRIVNYGNSNRQLSNGKSLSNTEDEYKYLLTTKKIMKNKISGKKVDYGKTGFDKQTTKTKDFYKWRVYKKYGGVTIKWKITM